MNLKSKACTDKIYWQVQKYFVLIFSSDHTEIQVPKIIPIDLASWLMKYICF